MTASRRYAKYYRFMVYLAVVVLVNVVGETVFFRTDLTSNGIYSLSEASRSAVATLSEPLTINVFFTKDLPAPHNNTERYLHDLLEEYSAHSNRYFNYKFYDVSAEEGDMGEDERRNQEMARNYGIYPVQIQNIEQDEVEFKRAYMGMVMIHGDVIDKIPSITSTDGLEYTITSKIEKMNDKISLLLNLDEQLEVKLFLSSSLSEVARQLRLPDIESIRQRIESAVVSLNSKYYGKLAFTYLDPTLDPSLEDQISALNLLTLRWPARTGGVEGAPVENTGSAAVVVRNGDRSVSIPLINVVRIPLFGTQYQLADLDAMEEKLSEVIDDALDINKKIGYLADHGTVPLSGSPQMPGQPQQQEGLSNFNRLVSEEYSITSVNMTEEGIPEGIDCLIIAGPKEEFNDYELFQIDQFLMKGKSIALFLDSFEEMNIPQNQRQMNYNQGPVYMPVSTGLEKLLSHYGAGIRQSYALDENCFEQQLPQMYGGGKQALYFAPIIKSENIDRGLPFMSNIKALIAILSSPVDLMKDRLEVNRLEGRILFSSSERSWEMSGRINLNPMFMRPPEDPEELESLPLALMVSGGFPSYFAGREVPERPAAESEGDSVEVEASPDTLQESITGREAVIDSGEPGKLFLIGSSAILRNNVIDEAGASTNAMFVMNLLDHLNGRDQYAEMRSKMQRYNPLKETGGGVRTFAKSFNIAGLPVIVALFGVTVWFRRRARKRTIQMMFSK